ncbi:actin filament-associated protein 1-like 1 isoform X1 [Anguilla anguilla]|uniref:actin filament-associated protein 1-like 1 isoform X1 n=2 Tax=Anguilla anguilla TaxID=7936 RepID=UPI0015AAE8C1|nr:actin filament-associated protein 1-like 1 isoform X1 [Anguilla anguilla]
MVALSSTSAVTAMEHLVTELNVLLKLLDHETLSSATEEKKSAVRSLLKQLQPSVNGTDYMYMNTSVYRNGTSFVESLFEEFDCDLRSYKDSVEEQKASGEEEVPQTPPPKSSPADTPPPLPTTPPPEDYYEEAVPLGPGKMPQYITTRSNSSPPNSIEDGYYEDAENTYPTTRINGQRKNSCEHYNDSDALSSSYESYDEEEDEGKAPRLTHQWPSEENSMGLAKDCRICAFLLRKKRFGQWAKQLTVIRQNRLQCYKSSKDRRPSTDVQLSLCSVAYAPKDGRRKKHELRFSLPGGETLVLAVQSKEQAEGWLRVIREASGQIHGSNGLDTPTSPVIQQKTDPDKRPLADKQASDSDSVAATDTVPSTSARDTREGKVKRGALSELTESVSRAAGRKITRIISFSKKKPPLPGDPRAEEDPRSGYLGVLVNQSWRERWCCVRRGSLFLHRDRGDLRTHLSAVALQGCEVVPGLGPKHPFAFRIMRGGNVVTVLEASCSEEMGRWLGVLLAETGCAADPESLHYDYVDVDTIANIRDAARHSFLWATSSAEGRTYDEVPYESVQAEEQGAEPNAPVRRRSSFSSRDTEKLQPQGSVKRHGSNANLYGKYGKTRAEEDARRYLQEKEELERERDGVRNALLLLRKERREAKEELKSSATGKHTALEERVSRLEESCKEKEAQRVELELKLSVVKENLRKSLAGGALGAPDESRPASKVKGGKGDGHYGDTLLPVNCASELRKRPLSIYASTKGNVLQKTKEWESKKGT